MESGTGGALGAAEWLRHLPARLTLLLGVVAIGLVVIPAIVYDVPPPWMQHEAERTRDAEKPAVGNRRFVVKVNKFEFAFGKPVTQPTVDVAPQSPASTPPANPTKPYQIAAVILGLAGLIAGPMAWTTAKGTRPLVVTGMTLCCAAILWHYVVAGLVVGVAVAILLFILGAAGG